MTHPPAEDFLAGGVVGPELCRSRSARGGIRGGEHPDHHVAGASVTAPAALSQSRLVDEAELRRHGGAPGIGRGAVDLNAVHPADLERDQGESSRRLGREAPVRVIHVNPVPDLERVLPDPRVETGAAENLPLAGVEDPVDEVLPAIELPAEPPEQRGLADETPRLVTNPRHPGAEVLEARPDRRPEE